MIRVGIGRKKIVLVVLLVLVILGVVLTFGFLNKKDNSTKKEIRDKENSSICGQEIIKKTNQIINEVGSDAQIKELISEIKKLNGYKNDANCINAIFSTSITNDDLLPIDDQRELLLEYQKVHNKVDKDFVKIVSIEDANLFLAE